MARPGGVPRHADRQAGSATAAVPARRPAAPARAHPGHSKLVDNFQVLSAGGGGTTPPPTGGDRD
ncbi:hypothetical protein ACFW0X_05335, partial [Streptomyces olivaceus]|uniref:hypothetical protein n=1 Tax=Streptomyces olivaceus TaxID=47716 RepID=UPI0036B0FC49